MGSGPNTGGSTSTGQDGYAIKGETQPAEPGQKYLYTREMPDDSKGVYWHVEGAVAIDGTPASNFPDGNADATEHETLTIQWDLATKDSLVLQLRRDNPESKTGVDVLADMFGPWFGTCTGHINYYGNVLASNAYPSYGSGTTADQNLCISATPLNYPPPPLPTSTPPLNNPVAVFSFATPNCNYYIWTLNYQTVGGGTYVEQWSTSNDRQTARFLLYPQVPSLSHLLNPAPIDVATNLPITGIFTPHNPSTGPSALAGQRIRAVDVQCTGYRDFACNIPDEMHVYYTGVLGNIGAITASGAAPYCRDQPVTLSTTGSAGATGNTVYSWTDLSGSNVGIVGNGTTATLNLGSVPPTTTTVTVQVQATDNSCSGFVSTSTTQTITLQLAAAAPRPQNMVLSNGLCASATNTKTVSVDPSNNNALEYEWRISGGGATFADGTTTPKSGRFNNINIITPNAVPVTVTARRQITLCGGYGPALSTTYQIISPTPVAPTGASIIWCYGSPRVIGLTNVQPGLTYTYQAFGVMPAGSGVTFTGGANGSGAVMQVTPDANGAYPTQFIFVVTASSPCASTGQNFATTLYVPRKALPCDPTPTGPRMAAPPVLYPNPTTGQVAITAEPNITYAWAKVMNAQGQLMQEQKAGEDRGITSLDMSALPTGIYLVQLFDGQHLTTQRLVKE